MFLHYHRSGRLLRIANVRILGYENAIEITEIENEEIKSKIKQNYFVSVKDGKISYDLDVNGKRLRLEAERDYLLLEQYKYHLKAYQVEIGLTESEIEELESYCIKLSGCLDVYDTTMDKEGFELRVKKEYDFSQLTKDSMDFYIIKPDFIN